MVSSCLSEGDQITIPGSALPLNYPIILIQTSKTSSSLPTSAHYIWYWPLHVIGCKLCSNTARSTVQSQYKVIWMLINCSPFDSCRILTLRRSSISPPPLATLNVSHTATVSNKKKQQQQQLSVNWASDWARSKHTQDAVVTDLQSILFLHWLAAFVRAPPVEVDDSPRERTDRRDQAHESRTKEKRRRRIAPLIFSSFFTLSS